MLWNVSLTVLTRHSDVPFTSQQRWFTVSSLTYRAVLLMLTNAAHVYTPNTSRDLGRVTSEARHRVRPT